MASATLMGLPLELRHNIFEQTAIRDEGPKNVLRRWFEKKDVKKAISEYQHNNPDRVTPQAGYGNDYDEASDSAEPESEGDDGEGEDDQDDEDDEGDEADEFQDAYDNNDETDEGVEDTEDQAEDQDMEANGENGAMADGDANTATVTQVAPPSPPAPVIQPHRKWRHVSKFLRVSHSPPPPAIFLACKELNREAKDWFYDVAVIRIDATGSFAHTSMFEESLQQIVDAAFSPFENLRKAEVTFVWDTEWMRSQCTSPDGSGKDPGFWGALLRARVEIVLQCLERAPELREVAVQWHDSLQDNESTALKSDIVEGFLNLPANINLQEYYLKPGQQPHRRSIIGKKRLELQAIVDGGMHLT